MVVTCLLLASSGSICALLPSSSQMYSAFATLRFLMGMGHVGTFMQSFTLSVEYVGPADKRTLCGCLIEVAFAAGTYSGALNKRDDCCLNQKGVAEGKSAVTPLSSWI